MSPVAVLAAVSMFAARGAPPDVPKNHWAYKAVGELYRAGILVGYPDGTFNGNRPVTRYELASALNLGYQSAKTQVQNTKVPPQPTRRMELEALRIRLKALQKELDSMKPEKADIDGLKAIMERLNAHLDELKEQVSSLHADIEKGKTPAKP